MEERLQRLAVLGARVDFVAVTLDLRLLQPGDEGVVRALRTYDGEGDPEGLLADPRTLIRRVAIDLTGLPPSPEEVRSFVNDTRDGAYERLVDRLLASPHYGERWGRWWLDVARYADSNGYSIDAPRSIWRYRDWVIAALNRDLPFDQFTIEQLAGDLLPNATMEQKIATGFHRNTQINQEGGIDKEQFRIESVVDRVATTSYAWLGLTLACSQCHDHKFDPFTQREYFGLFAMLNNQDEPDLPLTSPDETKRVAEIEAKVSAYIDSLWKKETDLVARGLKWEASMTPVERRRLQARHEAMTALAVTGDTSAYSDANVAFHSAIYAGAHNAPVAEFALSLRRRVGPFRRAQFQVEGRLTRSNQEHATVVCAIVSGDAAGAHAAMLHHVGLVEDAFETFAATTAS